MDDINHSIGKQSLNKKFQERQYQAVDKNMIQKMFNLPKQYLKTVSEKFNKDKVVSHESKRRTAENKNYFNKIKE